MSTDGRFRKYEKRNKRSRGREEGARGPPGGLKEKQWLKYVEISIFFLVEICKFPFDKLCGFPNMQYAYNSPPAYEVITSSKRS